MINSHKLNILFEDDCIIAVNKPAGLLSIPDRYDNTLPSVSGILRQNYEKIFIIHRLDFGTTGILLFAKTPEAHAFLNNQFASHTIRKIYTAVASGVIHDDEMEIDIPLLQNPGRKDGVIPSSRGKASLTVIKVIRRFKNATLIQAQLKTGRLHQLRAHTAAIGNPLIADGMYGSASEFMLSSIKRKFNLKKNTCEIPIISRPALHATEIEFIHPNPDYEKKLINISAPLPKDLSALIQVLEKYAQA